MTQQRSNQTKPDRRLAPGAIVVLDDNPGFLWTMQRLLEGESRKGRKVLLVSSVEEMSAALFPERPPGWARKGPPLGRLPLCGAFFDHRLNADGTLTAYHAVQRFFDPAYPKVPLVVYSGKFDARIEEDWRSRKTLFLEKYELIEELRGIVEGHFAQYDARRLALRRFLIDLEEDGNRLSEYLLRTIEAMIIGDVPESRITTARGISTDTYEQYLKQICEKLDVDGIDDLRSQFTNAVDGRGTASTARYRPRASGTQLRAQAPPVEATPASTERQATAGRGAVDAVRARPSARRNR